MLVMVSRLRSVGEFSGSCAIADEGSQRMRFTQKKLLLLGHLCHFPQGIAAVLKHTYQINGPINS